MKTSILKLSTIALAIVTMVSCKNATHDNNENPEGTLENSEASSSISNSETVKNINSEVSETTKEMKDAMNKTTNDARNLATETSDKINAAVNTGMDKSKASMNALYEKLQMNEAQKEKFETWKNKYYGTDLVADNNAKKMIMKSEGEKRLKSILTETQYNTYVDWAKKNPMTFK